jgi:hypothetical protein
MRATAAKAAAGEEADSVTRAERAMLGWVAVFFVGILLFGFVYAGPVLVFAFMLAGKKETLTVAVVSAAGAWAVLYGFFQIAMEIPLFPGLVIEYLMGF